MQGHHEVAVTWQLCYWANITWDELYTKFAELWHAVQAYKECLRKLHLPLGNTHFNCPYGCPGPVQGT